MNLWWPLLGEAVLPPPPHPWLPAPPSPVDEATLRRVIAGLKRLSTQHRQPAANPAEEHPATTGHATAPKTRPAPRNPRHARDGAHTGTYPHRAAEHQQQAAAASDAVARPCCFRSPHAQVGNHCIQLKCRSTTAKYGDRTDDQRGAAWRLRTRPRAF